MQNAIITFTTPKASISEMFRTLRTNVQFMTASSERNSILFTSTQAGDGKSWIAANLAITFAQAGKKVILVDDIYTTGATLNECSKILKQAGAGKVDIFTIAKD